MSKQDENSEHSFIEKIALEALRENRCVRRWRIFFKLIWLGIIVFLLTRSSFQDHTSTVISRRSFTAVVELQGIIDSDHDTAQQLIAGIKSALEDPETKGVIIRANSPGGSPVQAGIAFDEILRLKKRYPKVPIYTVVEDTCTSGCYYIASATDHIYADKASIIGSIGVISGSFGFVDAMKKLGIERRLQTAGENKAIGDPFSPPNPKHQAMTKILLNRIHQQFIRAVKIGRGSRLASSNPELFSGRIYLGDEGYELGLIDGMGNIQSVAEQVIKAKALKNFTVDEPLMERLVKLWDAQSKNQLFHQLFDALPVR